MDRLSYPITQETVETFDLPDTDGLCMTGIRRGSLDRPTVVMVHGFTGENNALLQYLGARLLDDQGFTTVRLSLYDYEDNSRNLRNCTLRTHADDFDLAVGVLRQRGADRLYAIGHSLGGLTVLASRARLDGAVLWEPSHTEVGWSTTTLDDPYVFLVDGLNVVTKGRGSVRPRTMLQSIVDSGDSTAWAAGKGYPLKIVTAARGMLVESSERYFEAADEPKALVSIKGAGHGFAESDEVMAQLIDETVQWFQRIEDGRNR